MIYISKLKLKQLPLVSQEQLWRYIYFDKKHKKYLLCGDNARFFNHSNNPNCDDSSDDITMTVKDIKKGEELTVNYRTFYGNLKDHPEIK